MKKPPELDIDGIKASESLIDALRRVQYEAALAAEQYDKKMYAELEMNHLFWQFRPNVQARPKSAPPKICPPRKKKLVRWDAFAGVEPIQSAAAVPAKNQAAKK